MLEWLYSYRKNIDNHRQSKHPEMKKILITGAAGFLGSHLCDRFINEGYYVIGMDNLITGNLKNIEHLFKLEQFEFHHHDVTKFVNVPGHIVSINFSISCSGIYSQFFFSFLLFI